MKNKIPTATRETRYAITSLLTAAGVALLFYFGYYSIVPRDVADPGQYTKQMASLWHVPFFDAIPQSTAYKVYLLTLALVTTAFAVWGLIRKIQSTQTALSTSGSKLPGPWILVALSVVLILPALSTAQASTFGAGGTETFRAVGISIVLFVLFSLLRRKMGSRLFIRLLWGLLVVYLGVMIIPGFVTLPSLESDIWLKAVDWHFDAVIGSAEQLRDGMVAFSDILPMYGIAGPGFIGMLEHLLGRMDFADHIRLIQAFQVTFLLLALWSFHVWSPRSSILVMVGAALIGSYMATSNGAILFPNLSGWRFVGLPLAVLLFLLCRRPGSTVAAPALGVLTGFLFLHSPEIAILVTAGSMVFLLTQRGSSFKFGVILQVLMTFALGGAVSWGVYLLLHRLTFGAVPENMERLFDTLLRISGTGFSGSPLYYDPTFVVMALLGALQCAKNFLCVVRRGLSHRERVVFAISVMSLLWLAYYVNRALPVNLWAQLYFLPFMLPRGFFAVSETTGREGKGLPVFGGRPLFRTMIACLFAGLLGPLVVVAHYSYFTNSLGSTLMRSASEESRMPDGKPRHFASGVAISPDSAELLRARAAFLRAHEEDGVHVITKLPYTTRLVAGSPRVWIVNPFNQWNESDFAPSVKKVVKRRPKWIVFDSPDDRLLSGFSKEQRNWEKICDRFKRLLSGRYKYLGENSGWEVWELSQ